MNRSPVVHRHAARGGWKLRADWLPRTWKRAGLLLDCEQLADRVQPSVTSTLISPILVPPLPSEAALVSSTSPAVNQDNASQARHEIVFVDAAINDYQQLLRDANPGGTVLYDVFVIGPDQDGMELMRSVLGEHAPVDAIHVLSHATAGELRLGTAVLDQATLEIYEQQEWRWGQALTDHGDILFYGCNLAENEEGRGLLEAIGRWTGADVAASTNLTGSAAWGGDWNLEFQVGAINTEGLFASSVTSWVGLLNTGVAIWTNNGDTTPDANVWDGSGFGAAGDTAIVGQWRNMTQSRSPSRIESIAVGVDSSGLIAGQMWNGTSWTALPFTMGTASSTTFLSVAVAYESQSGDAIVVWDNGTTGTNGLSYRVWNGASWSAEQTITAPSSTEPLQMKLASNPIADEMVLVVSPAGSAVDFAIVWNGSNWGNGIVLDNGASGGGGQKTEINVAYESLSGHAMVVYDADQPGNSEQYRVWDGASWSDQQTVTPPGGAAAGNDVRFAVLASDPNSNRIALGVVGVDSTWFAVWDGSTWGDKVTATTAAANTSASNAAVAFESVSGNLLAAYGQAGATLRYRTWTSSSGWSAQLSGLASSATLNTVNLYSDPYSDRIMLAAQDDANDLHYMEWSNSSWGSDNVLSIDTGENRYQPFGFYWDLNQPPVLTLSVASVSYMENTGAVVLDASATLTDITSANFAGGNLTVDFTSGGTAADRLAIRNQGTGAGQIGVSGSNVTYGGVTIGTFTGGTNGSTPLLITFNANATPTAARALVRNITYQNVSDNPATAARTIRFVLDDGDPNGVSAAATLTLNLTAVNDAPALSTPGGQSTNEDTARIFSSANGNAITFSDVDAGAGQGRVTLSVANGTLTLGQTTGLAFTVGDGTSDGTMTFTGNFTNLNAALNGLSYLGNLNFNGGDTLQVTISDLGNSGTGGAQSASANVSITVNAVNDAPTLALPGNQTVAEDVTLVFSSANGNAITVGDVDAGSGQVRVTLSASNGRLTLSQTTGLSFSTGNGISDATMTFTGTLANINAALNGMSYLNNPSFNGGGLDTLQISVNDQGNTGSGGALAASGNVSINVSAVNDPPTISSPGSQAVNEDTTLVFSSANGNAITVSDVDVGAGQGRVTLSVANGTLTLSQTTGLTFSVGDGTSDATMTFTGNFTNLNAALNGLGYLGNLNFNGVTTLQVTINDLGNSGAGGAQSASANVSINVSAVNDAPTLGLPGPEVVAESSPLVFSSANGNAITVADIDAGSSPVRVTLSVSNGSLTLSQTTGLTFTVGNGFLDSTMTFSGTLANINAALNGLTYLGALAFNGIDAIRITANDLGNTGSGGALSVNGTANITISAVNDPPTISTPGTQTFNEDTARVFSNANGNAITVADIDAAGAQERLTLTVSSGVLTLSQTTGLTFSVGDGASDTTMTFLGTIANINAALNGLSYVGNLNFNGADALQITINDLGNSGAGGALSASRNITLNVGAVNDAPTLSVPGAQTANEDTAIVFSNAGGNAITVGDVDAGSSPVRLTLTVSSGTLSLSQTTGLTFTAGDGTSDATMTFTGTLANLNAALNGLNYTPNANYNGADTLQISVNDQGNTGSGGARTANATITLNLNAINDAPVLTIPGSQAVNEDTNLVFSSAGGNAISINDVDAGSGGVQLSLSAADGVLTLASIAGLTFTQGDGTSDATMQFTGTVAAINNALNGLTFRATANFNGAAGIGLVVSDLGNSGAGGTLSDSGSIGITVNAVNDAPVLSIPGAQTINEDGVLVLSGAAAIVVSDVDGDPGQERITLSVGQGTLTLGQTTGLTFTTGDGVNDATMTFTGTLANINAALDGLSYAPNLNYNGGDSLQITINDLGNTGTGGSLSASASVAITVSAVNDAPTLTVPAPQGTNEDTTLTFSAAGGNAILFADLDAAGGSVRVTMGVANGRLTLATTAGLTFTVGDGASDTTMTFTGTLAAVNAAVNGLQYMPDLNYYGGDSLVISIDDQGNTGSGGVLSASAGVSINVGSTNDPPVIALPPAQSLSEDGTLRLSSAGGNGVTVSDPDALGNPLMVTLSVASGSLTLSGTAGLAFLSGSGSGDSTMAFMGTLADINAALDGLIYAPNANYNGGETLTITVNDQGNTGSGGAQVMTRSLAIAVNAINDAPTLTAPGPQATNEDTPFTFSIAAGNGISVFDLDAASGSVRVTLAVTNGLLTLGSTSGLSFLAGDGVGDATMTFTGTVANVNAALNGLSYAPNANYNGGDTLQISVNDQGNTGAGGPLGASASVAINVGAVNDAPTITAPAAQTTNEDTPLVFSSAGSNAVSVADLDAATGMMRITLSVTNGVLSLSSAAGLTFIVGDGVGDSAITFTGALSDVNAALNGLTYAPTLNYNGGDTLQIDVSDLGNTGAGGTLMSSSSVALTVVPINDVPTLGLPGAQAMLEDGILIFSAAQGTRITVGDVDAASGSMLVTLNASQGRLTLGSTAGLFFIIGDGASDATIIFTGSLADVQAALDGMTYAPNANYNGPASIDVTIDDQGNSGAGGPLVVNGTVSVTVVAVNDTPVAVDQTYTFDEDNTLTVSAPGLLSGAFDIENDPLEAVLVLDVGHGTLHINPDGSFTYTPDANYNGLDSFQFAVTDGQATSAPVTVTFNIVSINDAPVSADRSFAMLQGGSLPLEGADLLRDAYDVDGDALGFLVIQEPQYGTLLRQTDGSLLYSPRSDFVGFDSFLFRAWDGQAYSEPIAATIRVSSYFPAIPLSTPVDTRLTDDGRPGGRSFGDPNGPTVLDSLFNGGAGNSFSFDEEQKQSAPRVFVLNSLDSDSLAKNSTQDPSVNRLGGERGGSYAERNTGAGQYIITPVMPPNSLTANNAETLFNHLDVLSEQIQSKAGQRRVQTVVAAGVATTAATGYVLWNLRNFYLLASLLTARPIWRQLDPMSILDLWDKEKKKDREEEHLSKFFD